MESYKLLYVDAGRRNCCPMGIYNGGAPQTTTMTRFCSSCGAHVPETAKFCNECGARLPDAVTPGNQPPAQDAGSKSTFLALAGSTFVPGLGQVYEGNILKGYLVFFGTFFGFFLLLSPGLSSGCTGSTMHIRPQNG